MRKLIFVMGATATGKTYFIDHHFTDEKLVVLNIGTIGDSSGTPQCH